jgi:tRNA nucleotidyltransferase/poly(A) polymerase
MTKPVKFSEYIILRETLDTTGEDQQAATKPPIQGVSTSVVLGKNNNFKPFVVADDSRNPDFPKNKNLAPIIRAFKDSKKVRVYDSISRDGEPKAHTLGAKALFMVGGAVRDHLKGKTPKDIDLATDATPDEIRMILADAGFTELKKGRSIHDLPPDVDRARFFYVKGQDNNGNDFVFGVKVNGQEFELATFRKDSHSSDGRRPNEMSFGSHYDDAARRDLTFNSMYIALTNDNGPNSKLTDFHGGIHDLQNGNVKFVGNPDDRLEEDLLRALRYARFAAKLGGGNIDPNIEKAIKQAL